MDPKSALGPGGSPSRPRRERPAIIRSRGAPGGAEAAESGPCVSSNASLPKKTTVCGADTRVGRRGPSNNNP